MKAILFDLDGTLLPMDTDAFLHQYFKALAAHVKHIIDPDLLVKHVTDGTKAVIANEDPELTNEQVFMQQFLQRSGLQRETIWPLFDQFYRDVFPKLKACAHPTPLAREIVGEALSQQYRPVIATNPVFPRLATLERMRWAGIADLPFAWVTVYEESHFCKPSRSYYKEICDRLDVPPDACIMVGNDVQEDMAAGQLGMKTFLVTDCAIDRGHPDYPVDDRGTLKGLYEKLKNRQSVFAKKSP